MPSPTLCLYHGNCADGFSAAWAVWKRHGDVVRYVPCHHGKPPPDVRGEHVLMVDFSYKHDVLLDMSREAASVTILDHHKSALYDLTPLLNARIIDGLFDMDKSGAVLAWEHCHPDKPIPDLLLHVQDRDLWLFKLLNTRVIMSAVSSHVFDFATWDDLARRCASPRLRADLIEEGEAIERNHMKDIAELLPDTTRPMIIGGVEVKVANLPPTMSSDAAGTLAQDGPFGATYFDGKDGRHFSLRSHGEGGMDVSEIAIRYGGGGHRNAAGFRMPIGWEGDAAPR